MFTRHRLPYGLPRTFWTVPTGLKRFYGSGDLHFITASCYRREPLLGTARRRDLFLQCLEKIRRRYQFVVVGYVVMPEHFHLLISEPEKGKPIRRDAGAEAGIFQTSLSCFSQETGEVGHPKFTCRPAREAFLAAALLRLQSWSRHKRVEKLRYMHRNPVKLGLVETPDQWRWSSFRAYAYGEPGLVRVNDWSVLKMRIGAA